VHTVEVTDGYERRRAGAQLLGAKNTLGTHAAALLRRGATHQSCRDRSQA
jgi:hypothetical protein